VRRALVSLSNDPQTCIDNGVHVSKVLIPALDNTGTQAALIQRHSKTPNLFGSHDEWASVKRQAANGASGAIEIGFQHVLKAYNGPVRIENELKGGAERCLVPRINTLAGIQPSLAKADLGEGTPLYHVGLTSRQLWFYLVGNFDKVEVREPLKEDEQTVFEYVVAIAARAHVVQGEWFESENSEKLKAEFMGTSKEASLSALEEASLEFYVHSFDPDFMGSGLGQTLEQVKKVKQLNLIAFSDMNQEQKYQLCSRLADLGVTMDEYRANAVVGKNDVALESIGGAFQGALPYGLLPYEIPSMFATQEIEQPAPTQERQGGDEGSDNEDANKENSNNMEGDGDEAEAREKRSRPDPV
jgi:hypothetical protein